MLESLDTSDAQLEVMPAKEKPTHSNRCQRKSAMLLRPWMVRYVRQSNVSRFGPKSRTLIKQKSRNQHGVGWWTSVECRGRSRQCGSDKEGEGTLTRQGGYGF